METGGNAVFGPESGYRINQAYSGQWNTTARSSYNDGYQNGGYDTVSDRPYRSPSATVPRGTSAASPFRMPAVSSGVSAVETAFQQTAHFGQQYPHSPPPSYSWQQSPSFTSSAYGAIGTFNTYSNGGTGRNGHSSFTPEGESSAHQGLASAASINGTIIEPVPQHLPRQSSFSPTGSVDDITNVSPSLSDISMDSNQGRSPPPRQPQSGSSAHDGGYGMSDLSGFSSASNGHGNVSGRHDSRGRPARRGANRDEFDGPHQFLPRPAPQYIAMQERELPHLPTNLLVQEQDSVLSQVNDRLSQCAFDFVARYQFPIPLTQDMRPVARPQDREWTEWVQLLKRLATKRRIPARVLYNGQIKQFVTILENSLEMRHAARHQSRPLKDDRNILQLISAGIQVAKILKDAPAMDFLDRLYVATDKQIQERSASAAARFRN